VFAASVAAVNSVVMLHPGVPLSIGEIERATKLTYATVQSALRTLEKRSLVIRETRAARDEFLPNRESAYYPFAYGTALVDLPIDDAIRRQRVYSVYVYGSLAVPGGGSASSDIDLLVIGDVRDREKLGFDLAQAGLHVGRRLDPLILSPEQVEEGRARSESHLMSALAGVRIRGQVA
jgi:hypothetical protein